MQKVNIWDLDGTVINSYHRVLPCLDTAGNLNLQMYKEQACKHELIQQDGLLPLVELMRQSMNNPGEINYIVTARLMSKSDYYFLRTQQLRGRGKDNIQVFARDTLHKFFDADKVKDIYMSGDAKYKRNYFELIRQRHGNDNVAYTVYDDHQGVLAVAREMGFNAVDATVINDMFSLGVRIGGESFLDDALDDDNDIDFLAARLDLAWQTLPEDERDYFAVKYPKLGLSI